MSEALAAPGTAASPTPGGVRPRLQGLASASTLGWTIVIAVAYYAGGQVGQSFFATASHMAVLWPSPAIALAALLLLGARVLPAVLLGCALAMLAAPSPGAIASIASGAAYCLVAWWALARLTPIDPGLARVRDVGRFLLSGVAVAVLVRCALSAAIQTSRAGGLFEDGLAQAIVAGLAAGAGVLVITPAILTSIALRAEPFFSDRPIERLLLILSTVVVSAGVFFFAIAPQPLAGHIQYLLFPLVFWAGMRFGPREVALLLLLAGTIAFTCTAAGSGPFANGDVIDGLASLYLFIFILGATGFLSGAMQRQRTEAERAARTSADRFRLLVETQSDLVLRINRCGTVAFASPAARQILGAECDALTGCCLDLKVHPEDRASTEAAWQTAWTAPRVSRFENRVETPAGWRTLAWSVGAVADPDKPGEVAALVATARDITDQRRAVEQSRQHLQQLAHVARVSSMGEMASAIAHEINQPLTAIANYADASVRMLRSGQANPADVLQAMERVAAQAQRAGDVVRRMRSFVRGEEGIVRPVAAGDLVGEVHRLANPEARQHGVTLQMVADSAAGTVQVDAIQMQQVLLNLVRNAIEALDGVDRTEPRVCLTTRPGSAGEVELIVEDNGPGFTDEQRSRMFDPFFTTKADGMGIGLALSRSIVEAHGGRILAEDAGTGGARFRVVLPVHDPDGEQQ